MATNQLLGNPVLRHLRRNAWCVDAKERKELRALDLEQQRERLVTAEQVHGDTIKLADETAAEDPFWPGQLRSYGHYLVHQANKKAAGGQ